MFDGPTTPGLRLDAPLVVLDLSAVYNSPALGVLDGVRDSVAPERGPGRAPAPGHRGGGRSLGDPREDGRCPAREVLLAARSRSLSPIRHEKTKRQSLRQIQAGSVLRSWHLGPMPTKLV